MVQEFLHQQRQEFISQQDNTFNKKETDQLQKGLTNPKGINILEQEHIQLESFEEYKIRKKKLLQ